MLRTLNNDDQEFRMDVRTWLASHLPNDLSRTSFGIHQEPEWQRTVAAGGYVAPHWRKRDGGMELPPLQRLIMAEEWARAGAPKIGGQEFGHIGPILLARGTDEQKEEHIPPMLRGERRWAQGYSEPGAGSDLASLRTTGVIEGDEMVINGQKIWTTFGASADWIYALIRTGAGRRDITFILVDLTSPGITRRPIQDITGDRDLSEIFFDSVRVPLKNVVGEIDNGWAVAGDLLHAERAGAASPEGALSALYRLIIAAKATGADRDPCARGKIARAEIEVETLSAVYLDALERDQNDVEDLANGSTLKLLASNTTKFVLRTLQDIAGPSAAILTPPSIGAGHIDFSKAYLSSFLLSIAGGTNEIQSDIVARKALGLSRASK